MTLTLSRIALAGLTFAIVFSPSFARCAAPTLTLDEQGVIEALLQQNYRAKVSRTYVVKETASIRELYFNENYDSFSRSLRAQAEHCDGPFKEAVEDFLQKNRIPVQFVFPTNVTASVELVSEATLKQIFSDERSALPGGLNECWKEFYRRFPGSGGYRTISRVGFDSKRTIALIYFGEHNGSLAGHGQIYVLRQDKGKWILKKGELFGPEWQS